MQENSIQSKCSEMQLIISSYNVAAKKATIFTESVEYTTSYKFISADHIWRVGNRETNSTSLKRVQRGQNGISLDFTFFIDLISRSIRFFRRTDQLRLYIFYFLRRLRYARYSTNLNFSFFFFIALNRSPDKSSSLDNLHYSGINGNNASKMFFFF
ncbi:hypothetical protein RCL_jg13462.t1 [Rhizophagus clarus]|uniref:Uncharacterized protein n=1 Tax=Rhizophagus clarus TaxID=94130 RepID=A0A8H3LQJ8_9GLOM|nr:hypothetical protein RCL_jg13462.t1 [Rhizophagus clarus]